jgi:DNA-directed RNA polymerase subunit beta'
MVQLERRAFATSDLNDLYRGVHQPQQPLKEAFSISGAPAIIVRNEKRMLQEAVDALIETAGGGRPVTGPNKPPFKVPFRYV